MKKIYSLLAVLLLNGFILSTAIASPDESSYQLVWEDNFDGNTLDKNKWDVEVNKDGGGNNELQYYTRDNVSVGTEPVSGTSCLIITAKKENYQGRTCTSGRIRTYGKMSFKYGKVEGRIKPPKTANGLWPAFWMLGADYYESGWPKCGEIDILEMGNVNGINRGTQERYFNGWFHWGESWTPNGYPNWGQDKTTDYSLQDDFHLYTLIWDVNSIKMYLDLDKYPDSEPYLQMNIDGGTEPGQVGRYFHKPFNILLNMAIGGDFTGIHNINNITALNANNNYEAKMYVDYVKVYQKGDQGEELHVSPVSSFDNYDAASSKKYTVFVSPASDNLNIAGNLIPESVSIYNLLGIKLKETRNDNIINISSLPTDNYLVKIISENGRQEIHKFTKR